MCFVLTDSAFGLGLTAKYDDRQLALALKGASFELFSGGRDQGGEGEACKATTLRPTWTGAILLLSSPFEIGIAMLAPWLLQTVE